MASAINSDNGVVSGSAGLKSSADSSGVLDLQTNGTTAISISASQVVTYTNQPTYTGGTANGVMYLNGSKAVTTGTALTFDGSQLDIPLGSAGAPSLSTPTDPNTGMFFPAADTIAFAEGGVEAMRLDSNGNMGVGTTTIGGRITTSGTGSILPLVITNSSTSGYSGIHFTNPAGSSQGHMGFGNSAVPAPLTSAMYLGSITSVPLVFTTADTERMRLDTSGNLVVGGTTATLTAANRGNISINGASSAILSLSVGSVSKGYIYTQGTDIIQNAYVGAFTIQTESSQPVIFGTNNTERARITSAGVLDLATGAGAVGQIQFPATQVASANANTLDDYEEGTWTPSIALGGLTVSSVNRATYTKIGNRVYLASDFSVTGTGNSSALTIAGLPFTVVNGGWAAGNCYFAVMNTQYWVIAALPASSSSTIIFQVVTTAGAGGTAPGSAIGAGYVNVCVFYEVA
jgi:hypothetical protein